MVGDMGNMFKTGNQFFLVKQQGRTINKKRRKGEEMKRPLRGVWRAK